MHIMEWGLLGEQWGTGAAECVLGQASYLLGPQTQKARGSGVAQEVYKVTPGAPSRCRRSESCPFQQELPMPLRAGKGE